MFAWVVYDITNNRIRLRVADTCKDFGLVRFQKSVFFGEVTASTFERMGEALDRAAGPREGEERAETDSVLVFTLCDTCLSRKVVIGRGFDENDYRKRRYLIIG